MMLGLVGSRVGAANTSAFRFLLPRIHRVELERVNISWVDLTCSPIAWASSVDTKGNFIHFNG